MGIAMMISQRIAKTTGCDRFFDNCIQGNKEKDTGSKAVLRDGLRHQHSWKMIPGRITANIKNGFRRL